MQKHNKKYAKVYHFDLFGKRQDNGSKDENVFDIMQGVSINIFVKL